ncbi:hypothetical protein [Treponema zioleckii]|uniref:hypothetical protein n=1 Tax=Treponema zioleckii TaxID=331680 RepID=UPI00168A83F6|nr:hypothetical protein [Treponema zioleckii]
MKKIQKPLLALATIFLFASCTKKQEKQEEIATANEIDIPEADFSESEQTLSPETDFLKESSEVAEEKNKNAVDVDFTKMSQTMIFAQSFNMILESPNYLGKTVKFQGQVFSNYNEMAKTTLHSVIQYDATACCQAGFEFILPPGSEYPADGSEIEVIGRFAYTDKFTFDYFYLDCTEVKQI